MSLKKAAVVSALLAITQFSVYAQDQATAQEKATTQDNSKVPGSGPNPFSDCGIGAAMFEDTKWAAVTSNVIWDAGTTAVTSATASPQTCSGKRVVAAKFINDTYEKLAEEAARGKGEHLTSLMNIFECSGVQQDEAIKATRNVLGGMVAQPSYAAQDRTQKAAQFYDVVNTAVVKSCSV